MMEKQHRSWGWTHKKTHFRRTVSQSSIHVSEHKHDNTNLSLSQGNKPTFRSIERSVIPFKCSRAMQVFMDNFNWYTQTSQSRLTDTCIQAVTTCKNTFSQSNSSHPSLRKGFSNLVNEEKFWENFANYLQSQGQT